MSNDMPLVSIVISEWNRIHDLNDGIRSIAMQTYPHLELIIVDNCSNDGTIEYLKGLSFRFPHRIHVMSHSSFSAMYTLNYGFKDAKGELIFVLDDDAFLTTRYDIENLVDIYRSLRNDNYNVGTLSTNVVYKDTLLPQVLFRDSHGNEVSNDTFIEYPETFEYYDFHGAGTLFNVTALKQCGYYDESLNIYYNEIDLSLKMIRAGYTLFYTKAVTTIHKHSSIGRNLGGRSYYSVRNICWVFKRNFNWLSRMICSFVWTWKCIFPMLQWGIDKKYIVSSTKVGLRCIIENLLPQRTYKKPASLRRCEREYTRWAIRRMLSFIKRRMLLCSI